MGYTHYFPHMRDFTDTEWLGVVNAARKIIETTKVPLAYEYSNPNKPPLINDRVVRFNGVGNDGHETFIVHRRLTDLAKQWDYYEEQYAREGRIFVFCKTAVKPYDIVVVAMLSAIAQIAPGALDIGSDGEPRDWRAGAALATKALGREISIPRLNND